MKRIKISLICQTDRGCAFLYETFLQNFYAQNCFYADRIKRRKRNIITRQLMPIRLRFTATDSSKSILYKFYVSRTFSSVLPSSRFDALHIRSFPADLLRSSSFCGASDAALRTFAILLDGGRSRKRKSTIEPGNESGTATKWKEELREQRDREQQAWLAEVQRNKRFAKKSTSNSFDSPDWEYAAFWAVSKIAIIRKLADMNFPQFCDTLNFKPSIFAWYTSNNKMNKL